MNSAANVCSKLLLCLNYGSRFSGANHRKTITISDVLIGRLTNPDPDIRLVAYFSHCVPTTDLLLGNIYFILSQPLHCSLAR